jgi:hypothetical protein
MSAFNARMLDVGEVAVQATGSATDHLLVAALRHIVATEVSTAAGRVGDDDVGLDYATREEVAIVDAWRRVLGHVRSGRARAAREAYERQAAALRVLVGASIDGLTVGDAAPALEASRRERALQ